MTMAHSWVYHFADSLFCGIFTHGDRSALVIYNTICSTGSAKIREPERASCCWELCFCRGQFLQDAQLRLESAQKFGRLD